MTQAELYTALKSLGFPVAYLSFVTSPSPPFITYKFAYDDDLMADNQNFAEIANFQVELYTKTKDLESEKKVQDLFKSRFMPYRKNEAWLDSEKLIQVIYEIQLIGG